MTGGLKGRRGRPAATGAPGEDACRTVTPCLREASPVIFAALFGRVASTAEAPRARRLARTTTLTAT